MEETQQAGYVLLEIFTGLNIRLAQLFALKSILFKAKSMRRTKRI